MTQSPLIRISILIFSSLLSTGVPASDTAKEKRWADQIVDVIMTGEPQWLVADNHKFLSIYTEGANNKKSGGVIVIHGTGVHPNWADVVQPLRTRLPDSGWHTLSLQMPILPNEAEHDKYKRLFPEITPRINAGIAFLKSKGVKRIIIIGHSMGATMAGHYMATNSKADVRALVAIGATGLMFHDPKLDFIQSLKKIKKPILEISGSDDLPEVLKTMELKAQTAKDSGNKHYRQIKIDGANHFLVGKEDELIDIVNNYLQTQLK